MSGQTGEVADYSCFLLSHASSLTSCLMSINQNCKATETQGMKPADLQEVAHFIEQACYERVAPLWSPPAERILEKPHNHHPHQAADTNMLTTT